MFLYVNVRKNLFFFSTFRVTSEAYAFLYLKIDCFLIPLPLFIHAYYIKICHAFDAISSILFSSDICSGNPPTSRSCFANHHSHRRRTLHICQSRHCKWTWRRYSFAYESIYSLLVVDKPCHSRLASSVQHRWHLLTWTETSSPTYFERLERLN